MVTQNHGRCGTRLTRFASCTVSACDAAGVERLGGAIAPDDGFAGFATGGGNALAWAVEGACFDAGGNGGGGGVGLATFGGGGGGFSTGGAGFTTTGGGGGVGGAGGGSAFRISSNWRP